MKVLQESLKGQDFLLSPKIFGRNGWPRKRILRRFRQYGKRIKSRVGEGSMATYCRDIAEDEEFEKTKTMLRLMCELNEGKALRGRRGIFILRRK